MRLEQYCFKLYCICRAEWSLVYCSLLVFITASTFFSLDFDRWYNHYSQL